MFDPTGAVRLIPQGQIQSAIGAGGKYAVQMHDPAGQLRYIPHDLVSQAQQAGGKVASAEPLQAHPNAQQPGFWGSLQDALMGKTQAQGDQFAPGSEAARMRAYENAPPTLGESTYPLITGARKGAAGVGADVTRVITQDLPVAGLADVGLSALQMAPKVAGAFHQGLTDFASGSRADNLAGALQSQAPKGVHLGNDVVAPAHDALRQSAANLGVTANNFKGYEGTATLRKITDDAFTSHEDQFNRVLQPVAPTPVSLAPVRAAVLANVTPSLAQFHPEVAGRLTDLANQLSPTTTLGDLNAERVYLNERLSDFYKRPEATQNLASEDVKALDSAVGAMRDVLYDEVQNRTGIDLRPLKAQEGAIIKARGMAEGLDNKVYTDEAAHRSTSYVEGLESAPTLTQVARRAVGLTTSPADLVNAKLRRAFGDLPPAQATGPVGAVSPIMSAARTLPAATRETSRLGQQLQLPAPPSGEPSGEPSGKGAALIRGTRGNRPPEFQARGQTGAGPIPLPGHIQPPVPPTTQAGHFGQMKQLPASTGVPLSASSTANMEPTEQGTQGQAAVLNALAGGRTPSPPRIQGPLPPSSYAERPLPSDILRTSGPERQAQIAGVMDRLKRGEITSKEADKQIQRLNGGGGRKLTRPFPPQ